MSLFALLRDSNEPAVVRVPATQPLLQQVEAQFALQERELMSGEPDEIPFAPGHATDEAEIAFIENFALPPQIARALRTPLDEAPLRTEDLPRVNGFFSGDRNAGSVRFQVFDRRRLLDPSGISLILSNNTFRRLEEPGLMLDNKLAALYQEPRLYFRSFATAGRVLDLGAYYREATDEDVQSLVDDVRFHVTDQDRLREHADQWVRRRIAIVMDSGILDRSSPRKLAGQAKKYGIAIKLHRTRGTERIVLPADKKALKELLRFLEEDYYRSALSGTIFVANSKRAVVLRA